MGIITVITLFPPAPLLNKIPKGKAQSMPNSWLVLCKTIEMKSGSDVLSISELLKLNLDPELLLMKIRYTRSH